MPTTSVVVATFLVILATVAVTNGFQIPPATTNTATTELGSTMSSSLVEPAERNAVYGDNIAKYLVDLHDNQGTFDFCGGMMFQLVLSDSLRNYLEQISSDDGEQQPSIAKERRMNQLDGYSQTAKADNVRIFHGREIRKVPDAAGGMGFVLQLSMANSEDPEGWSPQEVAGYDGWGHDSGRQWRKSDQYEAEGFQIFKQRFGPEAFGLHHRFYLHYDNANRIWLSAEDGCEGTPSVSGSSNLLRKVFGF
eukprot:CAMPEP_0194213298 /NCGR_PEP_ID=MMETSP0156-20130528/13735_1 /TAXON_ID=33649 /ORGANISM="Thalassionema nitzschioides, Strain L26-B" /LENGTH=249 /DNA_ID=CAMNT_0038941291 /DNA_START=44 /DNA_END=793 /DNA_ORIENTATION=-